MINFNIHCLEDCGNAPKKQLLKEFIIARLKKDISFCEQWMTDDCIWELVGEQLIEGKERVLHRFAKGNDDILELHIHHIITHGNVASLNGTILLKEEKAISFCDIYKFGSFGKKAKIKHITSYIIRMS